MPRARAWSELVDTPRCREWPDDALTYPARGHRGLATTFASGARRAARAVGAMAGFASPRVTRALVARCAPAASAHARFDAIQPAEHIATPPKTSRSDPRRCRARSPSPCRSVPARHAASSLAFTSDAWDTRSAMPPPAPGWRAAPSSSILRRSVAVGARRARLTWAGCRPRRSRRVAEAARLGAPAMPLGPVGGGLARRLRHGRLDSLESAFSRGPAPPRQHRRTRRSTKWREFIHRAVDPAYHAAVHRPRHRAFAASPSRTHSERAAPGPHALWNKRESTRSRTRSRSGARRGTRGRDAERKSEVSAPATAALPYPHPARPDHDLTDGDVRQRTSPAEPGVL